MKWFWFLLCAPSCALSFGPQRPPVCYVMPTGERRCFANDEERRAAMSRELTESVRSHETNDKRKRAELEDRIRLRGAQYAAQAAADEVERNEQEEFDLQVEMAEQAQAMTAGGAGANP